MQNLPSRTGIVHFLHFCNWSKNHRCLGLHYNGSCVFDSGRTARTQQITLTEGSKVLKAQRVDREIKRLEAYRDWNSPPRLSIRVLFRAVVIVATVMGREMIIARPVTYPAVYTSLMTEGVVVATIAIPTK